MIGVNWTPQEKAQLLFLLDAGNDPHQIAATMNRSIKSIKRQLGILRPDQKRRSPRPWKKNEDAQLIMAINDGCQASNIAQAMGRSAASIKNRIKWLRKNGAPVKPSAYQIVAGESDVARRALQSAITQEDMDWMQHYRQRAADRQSRRAAA